MKFNFWHEEWAPRTDCCIAAAAIGGVAALGGAGISAYGATTAAKDQTQSQQAAIQAQLQAQQQALAAQQQMFATGQANLSPYIQAGNTATGQLQNYINNPNSTLSQAAGLNNTGDPNSALSKLLSLTTPGPSQTAALSQTPGFQFASQYGTMAADNSLAARGLAGPGGSLAKAVSDYNNGLASTQWSNIVGALQGAIGTGTSNLLATYGAGASPLESLIGTGANAAGGLASNATATGQGIANNAIATGQGIASANTGIGNANAGAATSIGNSFGSAVSGVGSSINNANILSYLSGNGGLFGGGSNGIYGNLADGGTASSPLPGLTAADYGSGASTLSRYGLGT